MATTPSKWEVLAAARKAESEAWEVYIKCAGKAYEASRAWLAEYDEELRRRKGSLAK